MGTSDCQPPLLVEHEALSEGDARRKELLEMGSESHEKLRKILCEKTLLADLENMTE